MDRVLIVYARIPSSLPIVCMNFAAERIVYGSLGVIRRYVNNRGLPLGFALAPFGSAVTNTASICDTPLALLDFRIQAVY